MITKKLSTQKFVFSEEYRQGVNDAIDETLLFQKWLLENERPNKCELLYDKMVNLIHCSAEDLGIDLNWNYEWQLIYKLIYHIFTLSITEFNQLKKIQMSLNKELLSRNTRNGINLKTRVAVFTRDCFRCQYCGNSPGNDPTIVLTIDHIRPITKGGIDSLDNYQTLCQFCNNGKSNSY